MREGERRKEAYGEMGRGTWKEERDNSLGLACLRLTFGYDPGQNVKHASSPNYCIHWRPTRRTFIQSKQVKYKNKYECTVDQKL